LIHFLNKNRENSLQIFTLAKDSVEKDHRARKLKRGKRKIYFLQGIMRKIYSNIGFTHTSQVQSKRMYLLGKAETKVKPRRPRKEPQISISDSGCVSDDGS
jgi:hypothetical protein